MIYVVIMRDGVPMRYFAVGARAGMHVSLAVVEDLDPATKLAAEGHRTEPFNMEQTEDNTSRGPETAHCRG
jgi:hypothetical protein